MTRRFLGQVTMEELEPISAKILSTAVTEFINLGIELDKDDIEAMKIEVDSVMDAMCLWPEYHNTAKEYLKNDRQTNTTA